MPLSDFVGLVLVTVMESPLRMLPPTNSLPPLRWPWPGLEGDDIDLGDEVCGDSGDIGGLRRAAFESPVMLAPGLKLKFGRAAGRPGLPVEGVGSLGPLMARGSMAEAGLRPVALENDVGADAGAFAGKTKGGRGLGGIFRGEVVSSSERMLAAKLAASMESIFGIRRGAVESMPRLAEGVSRAISDANAVAMLIQPRRGTRVHMQLGNVHASISRREWRRLCD